MNFLKNKINPLTLVVVLIGLLAGFLPAQANKTNIEISFDGTNWFTVYKNKYYATKGDLKIAMDIMPFKNEYQRVSTRAILAKWKGEDEADCIMQIINAKYYRVRENGEISKQGKNSR